MNRDPFFNYCVTKIYTESLSCCQSLSGTKVLLYKALKTDSYTIWWYMEQTHEQIQKLEDSEVDIRKAMLNPIDYRVFIVKQYTDGRVLKCEVNSVFIEHIDESLLPDPGIFL